MNFTLYKKQLLLALFTLVFLFSIFIPAHIFAIEEVDKTYGMEGTLSEGGLGSALISGKNVGDDAIVDGPDLIIGRVVGALLAFVGVAFFILIFLGGFTWMTAQGNDEKVEKAKQMIIAAVFGLIIVLSAYAITAGIGQMLTQKPS